MTLGPKTWDLPKSLKVEPGTPLSFASRTKGFPSKFKSGTPGSLSNDFQPLLKGDPHNDISSLLYLLYSIKKSEKLF